MSSPLTMCTPAVEVKLSCETVAVFKQAIDFDQLKAEMQHLGFHEIVFQHVISHESLSQVSNGNASNLNISVKQVSRAYLSQCDMLILQADELGHHIIHIDFPLSIGGPKDQVWEVLQDFGCYYAVYDGLWEPWKFSASAN